MGRALPGCGDAAKGSAGDPSAEKRSLRTERSTARGSCAPAAAAPCSGGQCPLLAGRTPVSMSEDTHELVWGLLDTLERPLQLPKRALALSLPPVRVYGGGG